MERHRREYHPKDPLALTPNLDWAEEVEREEKEKAQEEAAPEKTAFKKRLVEKKWFIRGEKDILKVFMDYRERVRDAVKRALRRHQLKMDIVVRVRMSRQDQEGEQQEVSQLFYGGVRLILRIEDYDEAYDESIKKIWADFDKWLSNGSGWILERVENLYLNTAAYNSIYGKSYIQTPQGIAAKKL